MDSVLIFSLIVWMAPTWLVLGLVILTHAMSTGMRRLTKLIILLYFVASCVAVSNAWLIYEISKMSM